MSELENIERYPFRHDLWVEYVESTEQPTPHEFSKYVERHAASYMLYLMSDTDEEFVEWLERRIEEDEQKIL